MTAPAPHTDTTKVCTNSQCLLAGVFQPLDAFYKNASTRTGRVAACKVCAAASDAKRNSTPEGKAKIKAANANTPSNTTKT